jgi:hypothetical protein
MSVPGVESRCDRESRTVVFTAGDDAAALIKTLNVASFSAG